MGLSLSVLIFLLSVFSARNCVRFIMEIIKEKKIDKENNNSKINNNLIIEENNNSKINNSKNNNSCPNIRIFMVCIEKVEDIYKHEKMCNEESTKALITTLETGKSDSLVKFAG